MKVLFFAQSRVAAGCDFHDLELEKPVTIPEFWRSLIATFPGLASLSKVARIARRETYLEPHEMIQPGDEVAIIPPVSGG